MDFPLTPVQVQALAEAQRLPATVKSVDRLAKLYGQEAASWAVGQISLREKAKAKFSRSSEMIFTREGLEMTAHERVAEFHASLFPFDAEVMDGTCGIGGDLMALARRGPTSGADLNLDALQCSEWNLGLEGQRAELHLGSSMDLDWHGKHVWLDPARRSGSGRTLNPESFAPSLSEVLAKAASSRLSWIKLTPLLSDAILESAEKGLIFVSHRGECVEALMQVGTDADGPFRRACRVDEGLWLDATPAPRSAEAPGEWIYEADPAAIRGHCLGGFGLEAIGDSPGWLTGDRLEHTPWLREFRVHWSGPWRDSTVLGALRELDASLDAVKTRGAALDPALLLKKIRKGAVQSKGPRLELMLYSQGPKIRAVLAERTIRLSGD